jgi:hypothetical protein
MTQTRRLAAILTADVVGYSRLMGADEEGTLERLKALRRELVDPKIAEHHGRIVKTTGDGSLDCAVVEIALQWGRQRGSQQIRRWREMDSNPRSQRETTLFATMSTRCDRSRPAAASRPNCVCDHRRGELSHPPMSCPRLQTDDLLARRPRKIRPSFQR